MKSLNTVIREMHNKVEETVDLDESTKAYAASLEKMASDKKLKNISKKDRDILAKLADMMKNANEEFELDEDALNEAIESIQLEEDYFKVQYFGKDGKPEAGKESNFKDENSAKRYLARAQKAVKVGEYKLSKERGKLESVDLEENVGKKVYEKKVGQSTVKVFKYSNGMHFAFFDSKGYGETNVQIKKLDKGVLNKAVKHFDDNKGLLGSSLDSIYEEIAEGLNKPLADKIGKLTKLRDSMKGAESREVGRLLVQLRKGESDRVKGILGGMGKKTQSAVAKIMGEELESIQESNVFGHSANHGITDSLLAAVNRVVTGEADAVEPEVADQNEIIEAGAEELGEAAIKDVQGKDGKKYAIELQKNGRKLAVRTKNQFGDIATIDLKKAAKLFEQDVLDKLVEDNTNDKSDDGEGLDKVQPKAVKKKFKDRKDKDIDNDGDVDDSDKFLHKKRKAISKAVNQEEAEADDEPKEKEDKKDKKKGAESVDVKPKLDEAAFKAKYGSRWEVVLEATANKLAMKTTK